MTFDYGKSISGLQLCESIRSLWEYQILIREKSVFSHPLANGETISRDWLAWSHSKESFFCFACLLFSNREFRQSKLCQPLIGFSHNTPSSGWKKLNKKLKTHQDSELHRKYYIDWKIDLKNRREATSVDLLLMQQRKDEASKWRNILKRYLDCILFLGKLILAFRGSDNTLLGENKGNFLSLLKLISKYDPVILNHLQEIKNASLDGKKQGTSYLSGSSQNQLIVLCEDQIREEILNGRTKSRYFGMICDATPEKSRTEQTTVILRYLHYTGVEWKVEESFLEFLDYNMKKGSQLAELYLSRLKHYNISVKDVRAQGYDNGPNMAGIH